MPFIDLKLFPHVCQSPSSMNEEAAHEFRENDLCPVDGLCPHIRIPKMRRSIQRQSQGDQLFLLGSVPLHGIRPAYLSRKPERYPGLPAGNVSRNTLAHANQTRDWRIYADFTQILIAKARKLYAADSFGIELDQAVYALDSTTIDLCLALFPWAKFRKRKGAVKLHTLLDLHGNIPTVIIITTGKVHDVNILDQLLIELGAIYIMDRGYLDFARLYKIHRASAFFVTRTKRNFSLTRLRIASNKMLPKES
jgi:hypothetical protein